MEEQNELNVDKLNAEINTLKEKLKVLRSKNRSLRKENKLMLEKVEKYPCCKHIDKRAFSLEPPLNSHRHNLPEEGEPGNAFCQNCDSIQPLYYGEITNTEMHTKCVWICTKCCDVDGPCSFGPEYKILCKICLAKRKKIKEKKDERKRKRENDELYQIQLRNEEHNNRLLM